MNALKGHFDGKVIVLDEPVELAPNQRVLITPVTDEPKEDEGLSALDWAMKNPIRDSDLPPDFGHQHDHYLYGTPQKREP